ncbi:SDR family oxidoreductase [Ferroacidibacillus organovorans]|uniref:2,4-dienoyl-CoA reductase n=1 Tax=Ferroacidibacillus organovorans TaxID=1765683 RepID=A0A162SZ69_9BACL|nr:SDR family oxidoreductase [Ferroacidibacillus organovorans]KYP80296.1 2,4-dienoyl-CoA reductase [Ferroacidibacillus organovorans]OAG93374.1 2,4-dienoyl-CoA reductase [Ferroacidibacillus organovorans]OPG15898.1 2,4-dienoyl-CoA reductase [Ferroacidibacillus organovorans]
MNQVLEQTFTGKVALVTGGGTGIGKGIVKELAARGAHVIIASRSLENLAPTVAEVSAEGGSIEAHILDVRNTDQIEALLKTIKQTRHGVDFLINNAAGNFLVPTRKLSYNGWKTVVDIVLNGTFYCTKVFGEDMIERGEGGKIINIVATYAWHGSPGVVHSAAAKAGVVALTRSLAVEWAPYHLQINAIAPGPIEGTGGQERLFPSEVVEAVRQSIPAKRLGQTREIGLAAAFLLSPDASFITGEVLTVDGGAWLGKGMLEKFADVPTFRGGAPTA